MNMERTGISSVNGKNLGIILVLFILLITVTSVFAPKYLLNNNSTGQGSPEGSVGIAGTQTFTIANYSSVLLGLTAISGDANPPEPSGTLLPYTGINEINLTTYQFGSSSAHIIYRSREFRSTESVSFTLEKIVGQGPARIVNIITTGEVQAYVSSLSPFKLIINDVLGGSII
ncbi:hypothetical protein M3223_02570 [Paenibacillus pasadenensis]|uniref:hypothetical protein n=1 Tax=Paenibacillus pasadenensis TaxID=217090 RepID=UPI00203AE738|nr:hypothetical protein [Paenibacillus pasadenensis]MCM3746233.1 hypothetical protein [Paenibacillus pasadenensis]